VRWSLLLGACALALAEPAAAQGFSTVRIATGLARPVFITAPQGDLTRAFVVEQHTGRIRILRLATKSVDPTPFLTVAGVSTGNEQGLLGLAFHPDYASNGYFYVNYTDPDTKIVRYQASADADVADPASATLVLSYLQPQANHNGGWLAFGSDGFLYVAAGDGGGSDDNDIGHTAGTGNAQDITGNLLGKILRIDVDANDAPSGTYGIPPANPFAGVTGDDEIWAYGLRNPWRAAFDPLTGDLYIADVGQGAWEEVDYQPAAGAGGDNWGWRCREGAHDFNFAGDCATATLLDPIHEYPQGGTPDRCAITGGEVYRGSVIPGLSGTYFFADFCSGQIWSLRVQGGVATQVMERTQELAPETGAIERVTSFGRDDLGEIYIVDRLGGEVFKIVPGAQAVPGLSPHGLVTVVLALLAAASFALRSDPGQPARRRP
jgi:glucose/arabinose dehydrogenase